MNVEPLISAQAPPLFDPPAWRKTYHGGVPLGCGSLHSGRLVADYSTGRCSGLIKRLGRAAGVMLHVVTYRTTRGIRWLFQDLLRTCQFLRPTTQKTELFVMAKGSVLRTECNGQIEDQASSEHLRGRQSH